jgi:hypothetical protein
MSVNFRDMSNNKTYQHQWIVLDGEIDAEWIESMNTVMDDNKMLTLASNERLPLTNTMRLLLEINHMLHCRYVFGLSQIHRLFAHTRLTLFFLQSVPPPCPAAG